MRLLCRSAVGLQAVRPASSLGSSASASLSIVWCKSDCSERCGTASATGQARWQVAVVRRRSGRADFLDEGVLVIS